MPLDIRPAARADIPGLVPLLLEDARRRERTDPVLWSLAETPDDRIVDALHAGIDAENPPFRQQWLIALDGQRIVGASHSILLPVPPIYAGAFGPPGLLMEDSAVAPDAPDDTHDALLRAAEDDLIRAGARVLLASSSTGGDWRPAIAARGYDPLTLYFAKAPRAPGGDAVRKASEADLDAIVTLSAENRRVLHDLHRDFWKPHPDADARFRAWMARSLTLTDRDMFVSETGGTVSGYAISQPATPLHVPPAHECAGLGIVDDFYHTDMDGSSARALFSAAEGARHARNDRAMLVVCPAAWTSRGTLLRRAGYANAITWSIRMA